MPSRYDSGFGLGSLSSSYHQERSSQRLVSATTARQFYSVSSDRLHRLFSPSSSVVHSSSSSRFGPLSSSSPFASPAVSFSSKALLYGPKRSVSYTAGVSLGEDAERRQHNGCSSVVKGTSIGSKTGTITKYFLPTHSVYDLAASSSIQLRNQSSSYHRIHHNGYSPRPSSTRLFNDSAMNRASTRTVPIFANAPSFSTQSNEAHSKSLSPALSLKGVRKKEETAERGSNPETVDRKRSTRRARTVENPMEELQRDGMGQMTPVECMEQQELRLVRNLQSERHWPTPKQAKQHQLLRTVPPLLFVTSPPPMCSGDEADNVKENEENKNGEGEANAEASAILTLTVARGANEEEEEGEEDYTGSSYDEDEEYSDEEFTDEEEWESDEGEWDEATVSRTLQLSGHESDFEFPFALGPPIIDKSNSNVLAPPPIFTASISYDGMSDSWGGRSYSDEGTNSTFYTEPSGEDVEVGFTLVQKCAMRGSDEEFTSTTSGSYTTSTYSSSFDEEEEENLDEKRASYHESRSSSSDTLSSSSGESAESVHSVEEEEKREETQLKTEEENATTESIVEEEPSHPRKSQSPLLVHQMAVTQHQEEHHEQMLEVHTMIEKLDEEHLELEELEQSKEEAGIDGNKEIRREETYVRAQELRDGRTDQATRPLTGNGKPRTDFAKKSIVQPMREQKLSVTEQKTLFAPDEQKIREENERKKRLEEEEERRKKIMEEKETKGKEERKKKIEEEEEKRKKIMEEKEKERETKGKEEKTKGLEDKSAQRKSLLNMRKEDRIKAEQAEKESARQKARAAGTVGEMAKQYATKTDDDSFAYKRSKALEPKPIEAGLKVRTFQPIQKPDPKVEESFDKQMAELREQMRQGSRKLENEFRDVSQGLKSASDEAKLKTKEELHRSVLDKASSAFGKAEQEKRRQHELHESERTKREKEEKESKEREKREKESKEREKKEKANSTTKLEPKCTVRRAAKEPAPVTQNENVKKGEEGTTKALPKTKSYWERGARRKTEELMKFKETLPIGAPVKVEETEETGNDQQQFPKKTEEQIKSGEKRENRRKKRRRTTRRGHRRRPFTRAPFDIDELLDWRGLDTFERMEAFFASRGAEKRPLVSTTNDGAPVAKRHGTEAQKVWISELRDIDKLYKTSELRDIKLSAGA